MYILTLAHHAVRSDADDESICHTISLSYSYVNGNTVEFRALTFRLF